MRGKGQRFAKEESMTEESVGPGRYMITEGSLAADAKRSMERTSKVNPAFGSRVPQRALPFAAAGQETPGPGSYQPLSPKVSKVRGSSPGKKRSPSPKKRSPSAGRQRPVSAGPISTGA